MSNLTKTKGWRKAPLYQSYRRPQRLGAFMKWQRENPEEARRIQERHEKESKQ